MKDYYLRFNNRTECYSILSEYVIDGVLCGNKSVAIDEIGVLYSYAYNFDENNLLTSVDKTEKAGYHANIRSTLLLNLDDYTIYPNTPSRQWA